LSFNRSLHFSLNLNTILYDSYQNGCALAITDPNLTSIEDHFILIASETPLIHPYYFHQNGFGDDFGKIVNFRVPQKMKNDLDTGSALKSTWTIKRLIVRLERK